MRRPGAVVAMVLLVGVLGVVLSGCQLKKSSNGCVSDPGATAGGTSVCAKAPPTQFNQLGQ